MTRWRQWAAVAAVVVAGGFSGVAQAESEMDILLNKLVEKGVLTGVEAGLIRKEVSETKETRNKQLAKEIVPDSARNWKWKGDLRLRDEVLNVLGTGNDRHRQRIRFRYGVEGKASDQVQVNFRIATGSTTDPISTNQSLNTSFNKKTIVLDLANLVYAPEVPGLTKTQLVGGIMENPLWTVDPMVWDADLSWDGAAMKLSKDIGSMGSVFANGGAFSLVTDKTEAALLWVLQGGAAVTPFSSSEEEFLKNLKLTGALAYHDYVNVTIPGKTGTTPANVISSNTSTAKDFNQVNPSLELASQVAGYPVSLFGDWVHNAGGSRNINEGFAIGLKAGKAKNPFLTFSDGLNFKDGWEAGYFFERLEPDAAYDEFVDSDFAGGGTNRRGNVAWVTLATLKNSTLGCKYFFGSSAIKDSVSVPKFRHDRIQFDWVTKF